jgi:hypothetical protein
VTAAQAAVPSDSPAPNPAATITPPPPPINPSPSVAASSAMPQGAVAASDDIAPRPVRPARKPSAKAPAGHSVKPAPTHTPISASELESFDDRELLYDPSKEPPR